MDPYFETGFIIGALIGLFGMYSFIHNIFISFFKKYADRSDYQKVLFWVAPVTAIFYFLV